MHGSWRPVRAMTAATTTASILLLSVGCSGNQSSDGSPPPGASAPATDPSATPSATTDPVAPATGALVKLPRIQLRVPHGWTNDGQTIDWQFSYGRQLDQVIVADPGAQGHSTLDEFADQLLPEHHGLERVENVDVDGVTMFHATGRDNKYQVREEYGAVVDGSGVSIDFLFFNRDPAAKRRKIVDSVLASVSWQR